MPQALPVPRDEDRKLWFAVRLPRYVVDIPSLRPSWDYSQRAPGIWRDGPAAETLPQIPSVLVLRVCGLPGKLAGGDGVSREPGARLLMSRGPHLDLQKLRMFRKTCAFLNCPVGSPHGGRR